MKITQKLFRISLEKDRELHIDELSYLSNAAFTNKNYMLLQMQRHSVKNCINYALLIFTWKTRSLNEIAIKKVEIITGRLQKKRKNNNFVK